MKCKATFSTLTEFLCIPRDVTFFATVAFANSDELGSGKKVVEEDDSPLTITEL